MASFRQAVADGAGYLELDVHATRDRVVVVIHDSTLQRTTNGVGAVRDLTFAEIERLDAGFCFVRDGSYPFRGQGVRVPALEELLEEFPDVPLNIEIKQVEPAVEPAVVSLLARKRALERSLLAAEDDEIMRRIRSHAPGVATSASFGEVRDFFERFFGDRFEGYAPEARALQIPERFGDVDLVTSETLAAAHRFGLEMHVWTVNEEGAIERLLRLGVDGVMSDFPSRLVQLARRPNK